MKIVHYSDAGSEVQKNAPREGRFEFRRLLEGTPGTPDNFIFRITKLGGDFFSPRHCHNFDQIRFILNGETDFSKDGKLTAGMIGYFPEGTAYGPQTTSDDLLVMTLQFGGASGQGYISADEMEIAGGELKAAGGRFEKGKYVSVGADGREHSKDAYAAIWEHRYGVPFRAPRRRYRQPIMIDPESFSWRPSATERGVAHRHLGSFSECETQLDMFRVSAGAELAAQPHSIYFIVDGRGRAGSESWQQYSAIQTDWNERPVLHANEEARILRIGLPDLRAFAPAETRELAASAR